MGCCCAKPQQERLLHEASLVSLDGSLLSTSSAADGNQFNHPAQPIGVSGGTAAFYSLQFRDEKQAKGRSKRYWVGKDLEHAEDELAFYERAKRLQAMDTEQQWRLLKWMFEYGGVANIPAHQGKGQVKPKRMLLLRNLYDCAGKLRLLDIKIGSVTAVGGWQGKSHLAATRNRTVDLATNSAVEGFRTEGFEQCPDAVSSLLNAAVRDRLRGAGSLDKVTAGLIDIHLEFSSGKKGRRLALQKLRAAEFLGYFAQMPPEIPTLGSLTGSEVAAHAMATATRSVVSLLSAASALKIPQQWIGSSVALGFPSIVRPDREPAVDSAAGTERLRTELARVNVFDWGRSELTTQDIWESLSRHKRVERTSHWKEWVGGILRLAFELTRAYRRTYCPRGGKWTKGHIRIWSFNQEVVSSVTAGAAKPIAVASFPLAAHPKGKDFELHEPEHGIMEGLVDGVLHAHLTALNTVKKVDRAAGKALGVKMDDGKMRINLTIAGPDSFPEGSVLKQRWVITVNEVWGLPKIMTIGHCCPVVCVSLSDSDGVEVMFSTTVKLKANNGHAEWGESMEFCAAAPHSRRGWWVLPQELHHRCEVAGGPDVCDWDLDLGTGHHRQASEKDTPAHSPKSLAKSPNGSLTHEELKERRKRKETLVHHPRSSEERLQAALLKFRDAFYVPVEWSDSPQANTAQSRTARLTKLRRGTRTRTGTQVHFAGTAGSTGGRLDFARAKFNEAKDARQRRRSTPNVPASGDNKMAGRQESDQALPSGPRRQGTEVSRELTRELTRERTGTRAATDAFDEWDAARSRTGTGDMKTPPERVLTNMSGGTADALADALRRLAAAEAAQERTRAELQRSVRRNAELEAELRRGADAGGDGEGPPPPLAGAPAAPPFVGRGRLRPNPCLPPPRPVILLPRGRGGSPVVSPDPPGRGPYGHVDPPMLLTPPLRPPPAPADPDALPDSPGAAYTQYVDPPQHTSPPLFIPGRVLR